MSGILKSLGKILPIVLGVAAVVFTGGAALGILPLLGGATTAFGALGGALTSVLGTGTLATIVTGAVSTAAFGAVGGAALSAVTGKDPLKGAQTGALIGAAAGGIGAGLGMIGPAGAAGAASTAPVDAATAATAGSAPVTAVTTGTLAPATAAAAAGAPAGVTAAQGGGLLSGMLNSQSGGAMLSGLGTGLMSENQTDVNKQTQDATAANYANPTVGNGGLLTQVSKVQDPTNLQTPQQAFNPSARWVYDNTAKKLVLQTPVAATPAPAPAPTVH